MKTRLLLIVLFIPFVAGAQQHIVYKSKEGKEFNLNTYRSDPDSMPKNILQTQIISLQLINDGLVVFPLSIYYKRIFTPSIQANFLMSLPVLGNVAEAPQPIYLEASAEIFFITSKGEKNKKVFLLDHIEGRRSPYESTVYHYNVFKVPFEVRRSYGLRFGVNYINQSTNNADSLTSSGKKVEPIATREACGFLGVEYQRMISFKGTFESIGDFQAHSMASYYADVIYSPGMSVMLGVPNNSSFQGADDKFAALKNNFPGARFYPVGFRVGINRINTGSRKPRTHAFRKVKYAKGINLEGGLFPFYQTSFYLKLAFPIGAAF